MKMIWATRGRDWGFRFLRDADLPDPLPVYTDSFKGLESKTHIWQKTQNFLTVRFPDPLERIDFAGRIIFHDFVVTDPSPELLLSEEQAQRLIWEQVRDEYADLNNKNSKI